MLVCQLGGLIAPVALSAVGGRRRSVRAPARAARMRRPVRCTTAARADRQTLRSDARSEARLFQPISRCSRSPPAREFCRRSVRSPSPMSRLQSIPASGVERSFPDRFSRFSPSSQLARNSSERLERLRRLQPSDVCACANRAFRGCARGCAHAKGTTNGFWNASGSAPLVFGRRR